MRKDELEKVRHYFMTGTLSEGDKLSDALSYETIVGRNKREARDQVMEIQVEIRFTSAEKDVEFWAQLAEGLCQHKRGAWLEEQFDRFGEQASALITHIMNECDKSNAGGEALTFEGWERDGNQFETCVNGGWIIFDLLPKIRVLLELCGVTDLYMDDPEEDEC